MALEQEKYIGSSDGGDGRNFASSIGEKIGTFELIYKS